MFPTVVLSIFTRDPELLALASDWLRIQCLGNIAMGANNVFQQSFMTAGATIWPMLVTLVGLWCVELPLAYVFSQTLGIGAIGVAYATLIANTSRPLMHIPYFLSGRWMRARVFSDQTVALGGQGGPVPVGPYSA
jgi:Na+-driven multidrug efflux pump